MTKYWTLGFLSAVVFFLGLTALNAAEVSKTTLDNLQAAFNGESNAQALLYCLCCQSRC